MLHGSWTLSSLGFGVSGTPGREGVTTVPATHTHLIFSTDGPAGVKAQVSGPTLSSRRDGVHTSLLFPSLGLPFFLLHLPAHSCFQGRDPGGVPLVEGPATTWHPGTRVVNGACGDLGSQF